MSEQIATAAWAKPVTLRGQHVQLEPLSPAHADGMRAATQDGALWQRWYTNVPAPDAVDSYIDAALAMQHDGRDRWYLEALGIGADKQWDAFLQAYLAKVSEPWKTPAGRDILWRSRAKQTPALLVKIIKDGATKEDEQPRYFRALDFLTGPEKEAALKSLLE